MPLSFSHALVEDFNRRPFFGHKEELTQLENWLSEALAGHGKAAFILGEPGSGKTYLLTEFADRALHNHPNLLFFWGQCNAYTGQGDPYFPFMTMIKMLAGDFESLIPGPIISQNHLDRLWHNLPEMLVALVNLSPDLIKRFIVDFHQFSLAKNHPGVTSACLDALEEMFKESPNKAGRQVPLNDQFTRLLSALSQNHPILLVLDDLQWIDEGSTDLLFHLGRQLISKNILLLGAFRQAEILVKKDEITRSISGILQELQAIYGDNLINLAQSQGKSFINELLASEPNAFTPSFHQMLYDHTSGHPLFSIELLRGMQLRNEIFKDKHGKWIESDHLDWKKLPARVEAVIARRFSLLPSECQSLMPSACIQGIVFSVEIIAHILKKHEKEVFDLLNAEVCKQHRLILPYGVHKVGEESLTQFKFGHDLFQIYLYNQLNNVEKVYQHYLVAVELENRYKEHLS
jgi:predicted ATPase